MKKVFKSKKGWMSLGAILVALTLIVGATFAWFSYVGGADLTADIDAGTVVLETNLPSEDWLKSELQLGMVEASNPAYDPSDPDSPEFFYYAQPGNYFNIYPEDGSDYFYIKNTGSLEAIVRISGASANVTWDVSLDANNNYLGDATVGGAFVSNDTPENEGFKNGVLVGMKLADPSTANDNGAIVNTAAAFQAALDPTTVILHKYDWVRGDHYLVIPAGMKVEFDFHIDLKTNSYEQIIDYTKRTWINAGLDNQYGTADDVFEYEYYDPAVGIEDFTTVKLGAPRAADILIDNKYQNCAIELTDALGVKATQYDYSDAWMDIFDFFDGEWDTTAVGLAAPASYGLLDTFSDTVPLFTVGTTRFFGAEDYLLPFAGDYLSIWGVAGNANIMTIY